MSRYAAALYCRRTCRNDGVVDAVGDIKTRLAEMELPPGYFIEYGGQFESQQSAQRRLFILSGIALLGMFLVLYHAVRQRQLLDASVGCLAQPLSLEQ